MKTILILTMAILGAMGSAPLFAADANRAVTVYLDYDSRVPANIVYRATSRASRIFAGIGMPVRFCAFRMNRKAKRTGVEIEMKIEMDAPPELRSGALGLAHPFRTDGLIRVFYSRIHKYQPSELRDVLLAYILAQEITHVLEAAAVHSPTGILKEKWNREDFKQIAAAKLGFAAGDIESIREGIKYRTTD